MAVRRRWLDSGRRLSRVVLLVLGDAIAVVAALSAAAFLLAVIGSAPQPRWNELWPVALLVGTAQLLLLTALGGFRAAQSRPSLGRVAAAAVGAAALTWLHATLLAGAGSLLLPPGLLLIYGITGTLLVLGERALIDQGLAFAHRRGWGRRRVLVIGSAKETNRVMRRLRAHGSAELAMVGRVAPRGVRRSGRQVVPDLEPALRSTGASEVVIASSSLAQDAFETLVRRCFEAGVSVSIAPSTLHRINPAFELTKLRVGAILRMRPGGIGQPRIAIKRAMDVALSVAGLILLAPLLVAIALVIRLDSPGPAVFRQLRTGVGGRPFWMYKFRTMVDNADQIKGELQHLNESGDPRLFKIKDDPRVTRVGRFLRRISLDELPQLLNVLAGEMSLIGPRPFFPDDLEQYAEHHFERLSVLPGITGLWQVSGRSAVLDFEEVVRLDRTYIRQWSVWLDLKILALTLPAILRREGAY